jgi:hypothetical protein
MAAPFSYYFEIIFVKEIVVIRPAATTKQLEIELIVNYKVFA